MGGIGVEAQLDQNSLFRSFHLGIMILSSKQTLKLLNKH